MAQEKQFENKIKEFLKEKNIMVRERLTEECEKNGINLTFPDIKYCTDNAAMIGAAAYPLYLKKQFTTFDLNATPNAKLY